MKVLLYEPGKDAVEAEIKSDLKSLQKVVGGYIETLPVTKELVLICNEEGKIRHLPPNRALYLGKEYFDLICGTFIVCRFKEEDFDSIIPGDRDRADKHLIA